MLRIHSTVQYSTCTVQYSTARAGRRAPCDPVLFQQCGGEAELGWQQEGEGEGAEEPGGGARGGQDQRIQQEVSTLSQYNIIIMTL